MVRAPARRSRLRPSTSPRSTGLLGLIRLVIGFEPGGRFRAINEPVVRMIQKAFATAATPRPDVVGAPACVESDRFDVDAKAPRPVSPE